MSKKKATQEELKAVREKNNKVIDDLIQLGDIESTISRLNQRKSLILQTLDLSRKELADTQAALMQKYGKESINLETGELK